MKLEKTIYLSSLFDLYGSLLTERKQEIFKCYYFEDISLNEIAQIYDITKQAVKDCLDSVEKSLLNYEKKLHIEEKLKKEQKILENETVELQAKIKNIWKEN